MQKATISARSGRRSGGCNDTWKRAKPDAKSDDFGAVWTQVRRVLRLLEACKTRCKKRRFRRGLDASGRWSGGCNDTCKRAKPYAKSDDFGAVDRGCVALRVWVAGVAFAHAPGVGTKVNRNGERKRSSVKSDLGRGAEPERRGEIPAPFLRRGGLLHGLEPRVPDPRGAASRWSLARGGLEDRTKNARKRNVHPHVKRLQRLTTSVHNSAIL